jgi:hypothetical protein
LPVVSYQIRSKPLSCTFTALALLNTPKLDLNQRKINEKQKFKRLGQSDISQVFEMDDIFTLGMGITCSPT